MAKNILYERKIYVQDFLNICRSCLINTNTIRIEKDTIDLFKIIPDYEINLDDDLPSQICRDCTAKLKDISLFVMVVKTNDTYLRQILKENKDKNINKNTPINYLNEYYQIENFNDCQFEAPDSKFDISNDTKLDVSEYNTNFFNIKKDESSEQTLLKCDECDKKFTKRSNLKLHLRSHSKENPHECKICLKKFRYVQNLKRHENVNHKGSKPFECETCGKKFATLIRKTEHIRIHTGERPYICNMCGLTFKKYSTYYTHEKRHKIEKGLIPKSDISKKYPKKIPDPSQLQCQICQRILSSKQALFVHKKNHSGEKSFLCTECGKSFVRKSHLEVHFRIHTGEKPYKCADCDKHFRQLAVYRNHLLIHKNKRSFKCDICQKSFIQLGHLQNHLKTHTGEKPYKCTFCNKAFAQNGNLRAHTRIHTNERPYSCTICYLEFYDSNSLKKHKKSHNSVVIKSEVVMTNQ